jgi:hypothetical protein
MILRKVTIMMFTLNASITFLAAAGSGEVWGVEMESGIGSTANKVENAAQNVGSGPLGVVDAVAGLTIAALDIVTGLLDIIFAAPTMFANLGVPGFIVAFVFAPLYIVVALDMVALLRGDSGI